MCAYSLVQLTRSTAVVRCAANYKGAGGRTVITLNLMKITPFEFVGEDIILPQKKIIDKK